MKVLELLSDESKWTKGAAARDVSGKDVASRSRAAVSWCLLGAVHKCYSTSEKADRAACALREAVEALYGFYSLVLWQDRPYVTFEHIQQVLQRADV